ncbi:hypothetical protein ACLI08_06905 [Flavobacterium sp. RNTU_13]|uniref:hypothetical protein n=1 Tax=Flavobacterium sp. RNTU_13 TaxID=3375145 RepID=UPI003985BF1F
MKRTFVYLFATIFLASCSSKPNNALPEVDYSITISGSFPLKVGELDLNDSRNFIALNDGVLNKIQTVADDFAKEAMYPEDLKEQEKALIRTVQLRDKDFTLYVILLKSYVGSEVTAKVLFYKNETKEFLKDDFELKLYALYQYRDGKLTPSNLKELFKITTPEIELTDYNKDGINDYKFTRLWHNGTFNAIHTTIISVTNQKTDTLFFKEEPIGNKL